ncbi:MAG: energy transducer TonB [Candidatus Rifleibacteriota bacterium]
MWSLKKIFKIASPVISLFLAVTCQAVIFFVLGNVLMPGEAVNPNKLQVKISSLKIKKNKKPTQPLSPASKTEKKPPEKTKIVKPPKIELPETKKPKIKLPPKKPKPVKKPKKKIGTKKTRKIVKKTGKTKPEIKPPKSKVKPPKPPEPPEEKMIPAETTPPRKAKNNHLKSFETLYEKLKNKHRKSDQNSRTVEQNTPEQSNSSQTTSEHLSPHLPANERNQFLQKVSEILQRNKRYPTRARRKNITGKVTLNFKINKDGQPFDIKLDSQAHSLLIKAAERMINKSRFPRPPTGWETNFQISVPVNFNLK